MMNQAENEGKVKNRNTRTQARHGQTTHKSERTDRTQKRKNQKIKP